MSIAYYMQKNKKGGGGKGVQIACKIACVLNGPKWMTSNSKLLSPQWGLKYVVVPSISILNFIGIVKGFSSNSSSYTKTLFRQFLGRVLHKNVAFKWKSYGEGFVLVSGIIYFS